jgi:hypothetical protein
MHIHRVPIRLVLLALLGIAPLASAGITTRSLADGVSATDLVNTILGSGVTISNVTLRGCTGGLGTFAGGSGIVGFESGLIMSSGDVATVVGPNQFPGAGTACGVDGDPDLNGLVPESITNDAAVLEFDFVPTGSTVAFQYVFASEEYNEFVGSPFNDVFGFFVNGTNLALLPGTNLPVAVNNVNAGANALLFVDNSAVPSPLDTEADGLTQVLSFTAPVNAGQPNHIKLALADTSDSILDSWIFISAASLSSTTAQVAVAVKGTTPVVDCNFGATGKGLGTCEAAGFALVPGQGAALAAGPVLSGPSGLTAVTKGVKRRFNKKGLAKLRLKLTNAGKKLLKDNGSLELLVVVRVTNREAKAVDFQNLVTLKH